MGGLGDEYHKRRSGGLRDYLRPGALDQLTPAELKVLRAKVASQMPGVRDYVLQPRGFVDLVGPNAAENRHPYATGAQGPSWRDQLAMTLADRFASSRSDKQFVLDKMPLVLDTLPGLGEGLGLDDVRRSGEAGNYGEMAVNMAATLLGAAPLAGDLAGRALKKGAKEGERLFTELFREVDPPKVPQFDLPRYDPPRGVPQRTQGLLADHRVWDEVGEKMLAGVAKGQHRWWNFEPLRLEFVDELGRDRGNPLFDQYTNFVSAASPASAMDISARNGSYYHWLVMNENPIPPIGQNLVPYGHPAEWMHKLGIARVRAGTWDSTKTPKTPSMAQVMQGNATPIPIDSKIVRALAILSRNPSFLRQKVILHPGQPAVNIREMVESGQIAMELATRNPTWWEAAPRANEYRALEQRLQAMARDAGLRPADGEGALWPELSDLTGMVSDPNKLGMDFIVDRIMRTARAIDREPRDVRRGFIRGELPLIGLAGAALGGTALKHRQETAKSQRTSIRDRT